MPSFWEIYKKDFFFGGGQNSEKFIIESKSSNLFLKVLN